MIDLIRNREFEWPVSILLSVLLGGALGAGILILVGLELRWIVYIGGAVIFLTIIIAARDPVRLLWITLLVGLQFDVHFRILYGHAGSGGLAIAFPSVVALLMMLGLVFSSRVTQTSKFHWGGPVGVPIVLLFAISICSLAVSNEHFVGATYLFKFAQYYLIYLLALNYVVTRERLELTLKLLLIVLVVQSLVYFVQSSLGLTFTLTGNIIDAGELPRPGGTVSTRPAGFASFVMPLVCIAAALFVARESKLRSFWAAGLPAVLGSTAILLTFTRAAWAATILGLSLVALLSYRRKRLSTGKFAMIVAIGVVAAIAAMPSIVTRLEGAPLQESYDERASLMGMAVSVIREHPLVGVGPGAYRHAFKLYLSPEQRNQWVFTVHNLYLMRAAETGILGGIAWVVFLLVGVRTAWRLSHSRDPTLSAVGIGCAGGVIALCFEMYWDSITGFPYNALLWLLFGLMGAAKFIELNAAIDSDELAGDSRLLDGK